MTIQDIIITLCVISFSYALIPQIIKGFKTKKQSITIQTSLITALGMFIIAITYFTIELLFSTIMCIITGILWSIILIQRFLYN